MKMTKIIALTIPIAFLLMSCARPAAATKPEVAEYEFWNETGTYVGCGAFSVDYLWDWTLKTTTYFDRDGDVDRITFIIKQVGFATNSVSGLTVKDNMAFQETYYPATDTWAVNGRFLHWVIPGEGLVLVETGHSTWYWDGTVWLAIKEHGAPHDLSSVYWIDFAPMCAALA